MDEMTLTRDAARAGSSAPALMPTGNPSEIPTPHRTVPANTSVVLEANAKSTSPATDVSVSTRITGTRPYVSSRTGPNQRPAVIADRNSAKASVPTAASVPWPSIIATPIQSLPEPSANANARTNTPTSSVRGSRQAANAVG